MVESTTSRKTAVSSDGTVAYGRPGLQDGAGTSKHAAISEHGASSAREGTPDGKPWARRFLGRPLPHLALLLLVVLLELVVPIAHARNAMHLVPTFHLDGAFQTASGLFRLADGDWPGKDFFPYLGIGPVVSLFPVFALLGGSLAASVFSSYFMTLLAFQLIVGLMAALFFRRRPVWALAAGAAVAAAIVAAAMVWPQLWSDYLLTAVAVPGNSLRPLRAVAPYLLGAVAFFVLRPRWTVRRAAVVGASAGAVAALWSNDYGLASAAAVLVLITFHTLRWRTEPLVRGLGALWGAALVTYVVAGLAATAGHFVPLLRYNLVDVRQDQFWYFGSWGRSDRVFSIADLLNVMESENAIYPLVVLALTVVYAFFSRDLGALLIPFVGASALGGGLAATWGGHSGGYFWSFVVWGNVVTGVLLVKILVVDVGRTPQFRAVMRSGVGRVLRPAPVVVLVTALLVAGGAAVRSNAETGSALAGSREHVAAPELGGFLPEAFEDQVEAVEGLDPADVVEEYSGLAGALNGPNETLQVDSVIAALGSQREAFAERMEQRPELVVTTAPEVSTWVTWNLSANWWFYRELFRSYEPVQTSPMTLNWTPTGTATWDEVDCAIRGQEVELAASSAGLYEVTLRYSGPGRDSRSYSLIQNNLNVAVSARGLVPLDPGAEVQQFPVAVHDPGSGSTRLKLVDIAKDAGPLTELRSCTAVAVTPPAGADTMDVFSSLLLTPVDLSDVNWEHGVHRKLAGLFIHHTGMDMESLKDAEALRFADGETRKILSVDDAGDYINVFLEGPPLDPDVAGAPNEFTIVR